ncbi:hypothetical protein SAMN02746066_01667 [Anaerosporobacter mobilis DSM 15930]|jgi:hypothetical protein|uniref:Uncharacterized protein n=1 Tax=Anaerosporobacter mobilis DSM 15930 TaxID=1120996 RepID=A0A1M7I592_9FIRM|nr:hypothetical protein [Anaerosporobacter mobilis]SHM35934.1 hypothetical protein SAMN02746066_01667 [Anaerosporobacter mobilis DSM 15930]
MAITIKKLIEYIEENLADGTLRESDKVCLHDGCDSVEVGALFNDAHELTLAENDGFLGSCEEV